MGWFWWIAGWVLWLTAAGLAFEIVVALSYLVYVAYFCLRSSEFVTKQKAVVAASLPAVLLAFVLYQTPTGIACVLFYAAAHWCWTPPLSPVIQAHRAAMKAEQELAAIINSGGPGIVSAEEMRRIQKARSACIDLAMAVDAEALDRHVPGWSDRFRNDFLGGLLLEDSTAIPDVVEGSKRVNAYIEWLNERHPESER